MSNLRTPFNLVLGLVLAVGGLSTIGCGNSGSGDDDTPVIMPQCNDGLDNDGDAKIDFPDDPGCFSAPRTASPRCRGRSRPRAATPPPSGPARSGTPDTTR